MTEIDRLLAEAERHLGDDPLAGEDITLIQSRLLRAQHAVLRAQIEALRQERGPATVTISPERERELNARFIEFLRNGLPRHEAPGEDTA